MKKAEFDYPYALNLLKRINTIKVEGREIQDYFIYNNYNFWQAYQSDIFIYCKRYSAVSGATTRALSRESKLSFKNTLVPALVSMIAVLVAWVCKKRVLIYSTDKAPQGKYKCDFRLQELYQVLDEKRIRFVELFHAPSTSSLIRNLRTTLRSGLYTGGIDLYVWAIQLFGFSKPKTFLNKNFNAENIFTADEVIFVKALLEAMAYKFSYIDARVKWLRWALRMLSIKQVYLIDDMWHYFELLCATDFENIRTVGIQHGHFTKYHVGILPFVNDVKGKIIQPSLIFVWTDYWKNELKRLGSYYKEESIVVAGVKSGMQNSTNIKKLTGGKKGVLVPYEVEVPKESIRHYIDELKEHSDIELYFKARLDLELGEQLTQYGFSRDGKDVTLCSDISANSEKISVAFGTYTTLLYDMIGHHISVVLASNVLDYGNGMIANGLATSVLSSQEIYAAVCKESSVSLEIRNQRFTKLYGNNTLSLLGSLSVDVMSNALSV
jgi:hypothetical protein